MLHIYIYLTSLVLCTLYCFIWGGAPEKAGASVLAVGTLLTMLALSPLAGRFRSLEGGVFIVDICVLLGYVAVALFADRRWPMFIAGLQGAEIGIHLIRMTAPDVLPFGYAIGLAIWGYFMLMTLAWATYQHRRRLTMRGVDNSWSSFSRRSHPTRPPAGPNG
jgi:hypothetical protein